MSPGVGAGEVLTSLIVLTLLYGVLAVVEVGLMLRTIRGGADPRSRPTDRTTDEPRRPSARLRLLSVRR